MEVQKERKTTGFPRFFLMLLVVAFVALDAFVIGAVVDDDRSPVSRKINQVFDDAMDSYNIMMQEIRDRNIPITDESSSLKRGTIYWNKALAQYGYTLLSFRYSNTIQLINMNGKTVYKWSMPFHRAWKNPQHIHVSTKGAVSIETAYLYPNGDILAQYVTDRDTPYGYGLLKMDKNSKVIWKYSANTHHDVYVDSQNNIYALSQDFVESILGELQDKAPTFPFLNDYIVKLSPDGKELDKISVFDALVNSPYSFIAFNYQPQEFNWEHDSKWDIVHSNTIQVLEPSMAKAFPMFKAGQVLLLLRNLKTLVVIDPTTKQVVWALSGNWVYPHSARFLDNGHIMINDNMGYATKDIDKCTKVVEFDPKTLQTVWNVTNSRETPICSGAFGRLQRLTNGNTMMVSAYDGRVLEITPQQKVAWSYTCQGPVKPIVQDDYDKAVMTARRYTPEQLMFLNK